MGAELSRIELSTKKLYNFFRINHDFSEKFK